MLQLNSFLDPHFFNPFGSSNFINKTKKKSMQQMIGVNALIILVQLLLLLRAQYLFAAVTGWIVIGYNVNLLMEISKSMHEQGGLNQGNQDQTAVSEKGLNMNILTLITLLEILAFWVYVGVKVLA